MVALNEIQNKINFYKFTTYLLIFFGFILFLICSAILYLIMTNNIDSKYFIHYLYFAGLFLLDIFFIYIINSRIENNYKKINEENLNEYRA
jgi:hypothetical protein